MNDADSGFCLSWAKKIMAINLLGGKCSNCGNNNIFTLDFHHPNNDKENGISVLRGGRWSVMKKEVMKCELLCRNCHFHRHTTNNQRALRLKFKLLEMKGTNKCEKCGYSPNNPGVLAFHHLREKKFNVNIIRISFSDISWDDILLELDKCQVLCQNCHVIEHSYIDKFNRLKNFIDYKVQNYKELRAPINETMIYDMYTNQKIKQIDIASTIGCSKSTICGIIKRLQKKGYSGCDTKGNMRVESLYICPVCNKEIVSRRYRKCCSKKCLHLFMARENRPTKDQLQIDLKTMNWSKIGGKYGVTHSTAIGWAKKYKIHEKKRNSPIKNKGS